MSQESASPGVDVCNDSDDLAEMTERARTIEMGWQSRHVLDCGREPRHRAPYARSAWPLSCRLFAGDLSPQICRTSTNDYLSESAGALGRSKDVDSSSSVKNCARPLPNDQSSSAFVTIDTRRRRMAGCHTPSQGFRKPSGKCFLGRRDRGRVVICTRIRSWVRAIPSPVLP
jgi:hypothetical protein